MFDAAAVMGKEGVDDYLLSPMEHADRLRAAAPKLAALLTHSAPMELAQQYADADAGGCRRGHLQALADKG